MYMEFSWQKNKLNSMELGKYYMPDLTLGSRNLVMNNKDTAFLGMTDN